MRNLNRGLLLLALFVSVAGRARTATQSTSSGFAYDRELELYTEAGIPSNKVFQIATIGAARVMKMDAALGSIEPGKIADMVLVEGDPVVNIADIRRVRTTFKDGRMYDSAALFRELGVQPAK